jgi:archaellum component FlaC
MKSVLFLSIFLYAITLPALGALSPEDLDKIRLIVKEEVEPIKTEVASIKQDIASLNGRVDGLSERIEGIEKIITWLMVLIVVAVGVPQIIVAWRSRKDQEQDRKIEELTREIEALKQQRIVNP